MAQSLADRIAHLAAHHLSHRAIADRLTREGYQISYRTVGRMISKLSSGARATAPTSRAKPPKPTAAPARAEAAERVEAIADELADDDLVLSELRSRLAEVRELTTRMASLASEGGRDAATYGQLVRLEANLSSRIIALTPPPIPNPEKDPNNLEARERLLARIEAAVSGLESEPEVRAAMQAHLDALAHPSEAR